MKRIILVLIMLYATAYGVQLEIEVLVPNSMTSNHYNNCNPVCANQENAGTGGQIGINGVSLLYIDFVNSHSDPGRVIAIEPVKYDIQWKFVRAEVSPLIMQVDGYKKHNGDPITMRTVWPKLEFGVNPFYTINKNIFINYNYMNFILVHVEYFTIGYYHKF